MKEQVQRLARLHILDTEYWEISQRRDAIEAEVGELRDAVAHLEADLDRQKTALEETRTLRRSQEAELKAKEALIGRAKSKLANVKNTREFMAAEREVESARRDSVMVEEQIVQLLEGEDKAEAAINERAERLAALKSDAEAQIARVLGESEHLGTRFDEIEGQRSELHAQIDKPLVARYERIAKSRKGGGMAAVVDGICSACNMHVPPQMYNELIRGNKIEGCPNCKRLLYWPGLLDESEPSPAEA